MALQLLPLFIASLVAGTGANIAAQRRVRNKQAGAERYLAAQSDKRKNEAVGYFNESLGKQDVNNQQAVIDKAAGEKVARVEQLAGATDYIDPMLPGQDRAPQVIKSAAAASIADELAKARAQIAAGAKLEGFSTRTFDRGLELDRMRDNFANLGIFAQGDRNVYNDKMVRAQHAGDGLAMFGDLLTAIGQIGLMSGGGAGLGGAPKIIGKGVDSALAGSKAAGFAYGGLA